MYKPFSNHRLSDLNSSHFSETLMHQPFDYSEAGLDMVLQNWRLRIPQYFNNCLPLIRYASGLVCSCLCLGDGYYVYPVYISIAYSPEGAILLQE